MTLIFSAGNTIYETGVIFNAARTWNSYRGAEREAQTGGTLFDFHRVALHEFGHALGLDHPDESGQRVTALMNSRAGDLDSLQFDDIAGGQAIYGAAGGNPPPTPTPNPAATPRPTSTPVPTSTPSPTPEAYSFDTLAGDVGYGSADGTGSAARFNGPAAAAFDAAGNLYVADSGNHTIRKSPLAEW